VYPAAIVAARDAKAGAACITVHRRGGAHRWRALPAALPFDESPGSPILLIPPDVRAAFDAVRNAGTPMAASVIGRPTLGVKCGCNDAFIVAGDSWSTTSRRPVVRGESLGIWRTGPLDESIVWTHGDDGRALATLPAPVLAHLLPWRRRLIARSDLHPGDAWWSLFRVEAASTQRHRVVWADLARTPRAVFLPRGDRTVPLNSCYVAACDDETDALAFCALLNSPLAAAWLAVLAEPARGGYRRFLGWTMSLLPIPRQWDQVKQALAELTRAALGGEPPSTQGVLDVTISAFGLHEADVGPLLRWNAD
jgi:hypothetical protein